MSADATPLGDLGPEVVTWLGQIDDQHALGGDPERVSEAAQAAGVTLTEAEATALAAIFADLGPTERLERWSG